MIVFEDTSQKAFISGFLQGLGQVESPVVSVAVAYDDVASYTTYVLLFHQVLYFPELEHHLISPVQLEMNQVIVNDRPLISLIRSKPISEFHVYDHSIVATHPPLHIPLTLRGTMSRFKCRAATLQEYENPLEYPQIEMTYLTPQWDPYCETFLSMEETLRDKVGSMDSHTIKRVCNISKIEVVLTSISTVYTEDLEMLVMRRVNVSSTTSLRRKGTVTL